jgi:hypothetical protein
VGRAAQKFTHVYRLETPEVPARLTKSLQEFDVLLGMAVKREWQALNLSSEFDDEIDMP